MHSEDHHQHLHPTLSLSSPLPPHSLHILEHCAAQYLLYNSMILHSYLERGQNSQCFQSFLQPQSHLFESGVGEVARNFLSADYILA